jgi:hypothetical protein
MIRVFPAFNHRVAPCAARGERFRRTTPSYDGGFQRLSRRGSSDVRKGRAWWHVPFRRTT